VFIAHWLRGKMRESRFEENLFVTGPGAPRFLSKGAERRGLFVAEMERDHRVGLFFPAHLAGQDSDASESYTGYDA
jgi:hypothetical protein